MAGREGHDAYLWGDFDVIRSNVVSERPARAGALLTRRHNRHQTDVVPVPMECTLMGQLRDCHMRSWLSREGRGSISPVPALVTSTGSESRWPQLTASATCWSNDLG